MVEEDGTHLWFKGLIISLINNQNKTEKASSGLSAKDFCLHVPCLWACELNNGGFQLLAIINHTSNIFRPVSASVFVFSNILPIVS